MKKRVLALLLSGSMLFSGIGTAKAAEPEAFTGDASGDEVELTQEDESRGADYEEIEESFDETIEGSDLSSDIETDSEDTVFATGLNRGEREYEILRGDAYEDAEFEAVYDSRYINRNLPPLRDQYPYGTCWAFATMALAEINLMKNGIYSTPDLSELHLSYFAYNTVVDPLGGTEGDYRTFRNKELLDYGGDFERAFDTLHKWTGAASESKVPYSWGSQALRSGLSEALAYDDQVHIESSYMAQVDMKAFRSSRNLSALNPIKKMITDYGAAGIYFGAVNSMQGVTSQKIYSSTYKSYYNSTPMTSNHAVVVVGWDDNFPKENFAKTAPGNGAFLVRNSWSTNGSLDNMDYTGYFWMSYYEATLDNYFYAVKAAKADKYTYNYQYDGYSSGYYGLADMGANVFTVNGNKKGKGEFIDAVSFYSMAEGTSYKIEILRNVKDTPNSGVSAGVTTGTTEFAGYQTVRLNTPVLVSEGSKFAVCVTLGSKALMYDANIADDNYQVSAKAGQSYWGYGTKWYSWDYNFRIKAYTEDAGSSDIDPTPAPPDTGLKEITLKRQTNAKWNGERWVMVSRIVPQYNPSDYVPRGKMAFSSSDPSIVSVDTDGILTFKKVGKVIITGTVDGVKGSIEISSSSYDIPAPIEEPGGGSDDNPGGDPIDDPGEDPIDDPGEDPIDDPGEDPVDDPDVDPVEDIDDWGDVDDDFVRDYFDNNASKVPEEIWYVVGDDVIDSYDDDSSELPYEKTYTGKKITFNSDISVYFGKSRLKSGKDYSISYAKNVAPNTGSEVKPSFTVKFKNKNYINRKFFFSIEKADLKSAVVTSGSVVAVAKGKKKLGSIKPKVSFGGKALKAGRDYRLEYTGKGGVIENPSGIVLDEEQSEYNINIIATDTGFFEGKTLNTVKVVVYNAKDSDIAKASGFKAKGRDGKALKFNYCDIKKSSDIPGKFRSGDAVVYYKNRPLKYGYDYEVIGIEADYSSVGTHKVCIAGKKGDLRYMGSKVISFKVLPYDFSRDSEAASRLSIRVSAEKYTGSAVKPTPVVYFTGPDGKVQELVNGVDYTVSYKNNILAASSDDINAPKVIIKGKGRFKGTATKTFSIVAD